MPTGKTYIFLGPEIGKKQDAIDEIRKKLRAADAAIEETTFYAGETTAFAIASTVQNHSLFAQSRLFIIKSAEKITKKDEVAAIVSCVKDLEANTTLILVSEEFRLAAALDDCCPKENRNVFYELFENEKNEWIRSFFRREGRTITAGGIEAILELVENNTDALRRECSRLMLFLPNDRTIEAADIEQWLSHGREESAFTLFSRIAEGNIAKAIECLRTLLGAKESPQSIFAGLAWCFRKLRDYLSLLEVGEPSSFDLKKIGISTPKSKSDYNAAARRYNAAAADFCLALTAEYDILVRSSGTTFEQILMDTYVLKVMGKAKRG